MLADIRNVRSSPPEVFPGKGILKICSKFSEHLFLRTLLGGYFLNVQPMASSLSNYLIHVFRITGSNFQTVFNCPSDTFSTVLLELYDSLSVLKILS